MKKQTARTTYRLLLPDRADDGLGRRLRHSPAGPRRDLQKSDAVKPKCPTHVLQTKQRVGMEANSSPAALAKLSS